MYYRTGKGKNIKTGKGCNIDILIKLENGEFCSVKEKITERNSPLVVLGYRIMI